MAIDLDPPIDNTRYMTFCRISNSWLGFQAIPKGSDKLAVPAPGEGLDQLMDIVDAVDSRLKTIETMGATPAPDCFIGVWKGNTTQSLASSAVMANPTFTWTSAFSATGTPSATFNTSTGLITINTAGYWRITYHMYVTGSSTPTEGYITAMLKDSALAAAPIRLMRSVAMETRAGETSVFKSVLCRVSTGAGNFDLDTTKSYYLTAVQENSSALAVTIGGSDTWLSIEYVRPL